MKPYGRHKNLWTKNINGPVVKTVKIPLTGTASLTGGGSFAWTNPEPYDIVINRVTVDVTTKSTAASTLSVGTAASLTTSSPNLIDTLNTGAAAVTTDNLQTPGTNGKQLQRLSAGGFVTGTVATGTSVGIVGNVYLEYFTL